MAKLSTTIHNYAWFIKAVGAALLLALAITLRFVDVDVLIEAFVGVIILVYALIRIIPFVRTQKSDLIKTINIIEIVLNVLVGAIFIFGAFTTEDGLGDWFGYLLGGVLFVRGMVHFYGLSNGAESGDHVTYFFHIAALAIGTLLIFSRGFNSEDLAILLAVIALMGTVYLGYDSFNGYNLYRRGKTMEKSKSDTVQDRPRKGYDAPGDTDEDRDRPVA